MRSVPREDCAVIVFANDDPLPMAFASLSDAEGYMEAIDVEDGLYRPTATEGAWPGGVYAVDGRLVEARAANNWVELEVTVRQDAAGLRRLLSSVAERGIVAGDPEDPVAIARELLAQQWRSRWPRRPRWLDQRLHGAGPPTI
jgi:hypothetical protein